LIGLSKKDQLARHAPLKQKAYKNPDYLSWCHNQNFGCLVCGSNNIELHHVDNGIGRRSDDTVVVLCSEHHRGKFSPHGFDSDKFSEQYPKELLLEIAETLHNRYLEEING